MNVIDALISHHRELRQLFQESMNDPAVYDEFARHLTIHHTMEEKYFYDLLKNKAPARNDALEAVNEHHIIEMIMQDSSRFPRDHEQFAIKVESLGEYTSHHLDEEEEEIFPEARELFSEEDLNTLGDLFNTAKKNLLSVETPSLPDSFAARNKSESSRSSATVENQADSGEDGEDHAEETKGSSDLGIGSLKEKP